MSPYSADPDQIGFCYTFTIMKSNWSGANFYDISLDKMTHS